MTMKPIYTSSRAQDCIGLDTHSAIHCYVNRKTITQAYPTRTNVREAWRDPITKELPPAGSPLFFDDEDQSFRDLSYATGETFLNAIDIQSRASNRIIAEFPTSPLIVYAPLEIHPHCDWRERALRIARCAPLFDKAFANSICSYWNENWQDLNSASAKMYRDAQAYMETPPLLLATVSDRNFNGPPGTWPNGSVGEVGRLIEDDGLLLAMFTQAAQNCDGIAMWDGGPWYDWTEGITDAAVTLARRQRFYDLVHQAIKEAAV